MKIIKESPLLKHSGAVLAVIPCLALLLAAPATPAQPGPPVINSNSIATNGGNIILTASASDSVDFYYQWKLNGNSIPGAANTCSPGTTNITYTITNALPVDSGIYQVVVANAAASAESQLFDVAVSGFGAPITTNDNFDSSFTFDPIVNGVAGINGSSSLPLADGPALIAGKPAAGFLWYNWTANFSGVITLTTRGSSFDTLLGVYTGTNVNELTSVAEDDDSGGFFTSLVSFNCNDGTTYQIVVAGYKGDTGNVVLGLSPGPPFLPGPEHGYDQGPPAPLITQQSADQIVQAGDTVTNSVTAGDATGYQWFFAGLPVEDGTNSTLVITNFQADAVGNYYAQVSNSFGAVESTIATIEIAAQTNNGQAGTPTNLLVDKFGDAVDLTGAGSPERFRPLDGGAETGGFTLSQSFSTTGATKEQGEPNHAGQPGGASYWYSYTAQAAGTLQFNTAGSTFNTILAVYVGPGDSFSTLTNVGAAYTTDYADQGQPSVVISNVVAGTKYFVAIDGFLGASGTARLNISDGQPPDITTNPQSQTNIPGSNVTFNVIVSGSTNFFYQWQFDGTNIPGATLASFTTNNVTNASAGNYTVIVSNPYGTVTSAPPAVLTVQSAPWIEMQPVSGPSPTPLSVTAGGVAPLTYQWYFMPANLVTNLIANATNTTLVPGNGGTYFVVVSNTFGIATSSNALVSGPGASGPSLPTNRQPVVAITSPANNFLATSSNIIVLGTIKGSGANPPALTSLQITVNTNSPVLGALGPLARGAIEWSCKLTLVPGANVITAQSINTNGTATVSFPATRTVFYDTTPPATRSKSLLTLLISPGGSGRISGQAGNASLEIGKIYTVTAAPAGNWVFANWAAGTNTNNLGPLPGGASLAFDMSSNLILQASFVTNPFPAVAGVYNGLFSPSNGVSEETSGFLTVTLAAAGHGAYSARMRLNGGSQPFSGLFDLSGNAEAALVSAGNTPLTINLHLNLDPAAPDGQITGSVNNYASNGWTSGLLARRATNALPPAEFTLLIPPDTNNAPPNSSPGGDGYALITNSAGTAKNPASASAKITGALADGTAFNQSVPVSRTGFVPLYANLYSGKGLLLGWINLDLTNAAASSLTWIYPGRATGTYKNGFTNTLPTNQIRLSPWTNPPGNLGLLTNLSLLGAINETNSVTTIPVHVSSAGKVSGSEATGPVVSGTVNLKTGLLKVSIGSGANNANGYGAILSNATNAGGYFLTKTNAQAINLGP
jgi:hypothetical protein